MMMLPSGTGVRVHMAVGMTDMRKGLDGLAMLVQGVLNADPFCGHLFAFRGRHRIAERNPFRIAIGEPDQDPVLGRQWPVPVHQAP